MLGWLIAAIIALAIGGLAIGRGNRRRGRRDRRLARRRRHLGYRRLWDQIMIRPRAKRLTFEDRDG